MKFWLDGQISPKIGPWITEHFDLECVHIRYLGFMSAEDRVIFDQARIANATVITKDLDFLDLLQRFGPPPQILWVTCGNASNKNLKEILTRVLPPALKLLRSELFVEISD